jgi:hypothetical protein
LKAASTSAAMCHFRTLLATRDRLYFGADSRLYAFLS